jgi:hypothetical protein
MSSSARSRPPTPPTGVDFALTGSNPWAFAGILDGEAGFGETQNADSNNFFGWGVGVVATGRRNLVIARTFTAIEDNKQTLALRYDTSGITFGSGGRTGTLAGRDLQAKFKFGFQLQKGTHAAPPDLQELRPDRHPRDVTEGENNIFSLPVTVTIYPEIDPTTGKPIYWQEYVGPVVVVP